MNGTTVSRVEEDAADLLWTSTDPTSGLELAFAADGANTDLRIALDDPSLAQPSDGTLFIWTWDMVFGPGGELACAIASSAQNGQIAWNFDCDPDDRIDRASGRPPRRPWWARSRGRGAGSARPAGLVLAAQRPDSDRDLQRRLHVRARFPLDLVRAGRSRGGPRRGRARVAATTQPVIQQVNEAAAAALASATSERRPDRVADARGDEHRGADRAAAAARRAGCERARGRDSQRRSQYEHRHRGRRSAGEPGGRRRRGEGRVDRCSADRAARCRRGLAPGTGRPPADHDDAGALVRRDRDDREERQLWALGRWHVDPDDEQPRLRRRRRDLDGPPDGRAGAGRLELGAGSGRRPVGRGHAGTRGSSPQPASWTP